jgi:hypothetical protein
MARTSIMTAACQAFKRLGPHNVHRMLNALRVGEKQVLSSATGPEVTNVKYAQGGAQDSETHYHP